MPNTKNFSLRERILDRLLSRRDGVSVQDAIRVINRHLSERGVPLVKSKDTILNDLTEISNANFVEIETLQDKFDRRIVRYRYKDPSFSIYKSPLTQQDVKQIRGALDILSQFEGMPQMSWIRDLCARFDVSLSTTGQPVVEFEDSDSIFGRSAGISLPRTPAI